MPGRPAGARTSIWPLAMSLVFSWRQQMVQCTPVTIVTKQRSDVFITRTNMNHTHQSLAVIVYRVTLGWAAPQRPRALGTKQEGPPSVGAMPLPPPCSEGETHFMSCERSLLSTNMLTNKMRLRSPLSRLELLALCPLPRA